MRLGSQSQGLMPVCLLSCGMLILLSWRYVANGSLAPSPWKNSQLLAKETAVNVSGNIDHSVTTQTPPPAKDMLQCCGAPAQSTGSGLSNRDFNVYNTFISKNVTDVRKARSLTSVERLDLEKATGLRYSAAERLFLLYSSYIRSYNRREYVLLLDPGPCDTGYVSTVVIVHTLPQSLSRRMNVRQRLLPFRQNGYRVVFIMGLWASAHEKDIQKEAKLYDDIVCADFEEDYNNLTIKTLTMLRWAERNCPTAHHLIKVDDDVQLNIANLERILSTNSSSSRAVMGSISFKDAPFRNVDQKWYLPLFMYEKPLLPPFAHGPCYALTTDLLPEIIQAAARVNYIHLEDVFLAMCIDQLKDVHFLHNEKFISGRCSDSEAVAIHGPVCSP